MATIQYPTFETIGINDESIDVSDTIANLISNGFLTAGQPLNDSATFSKYTGEYNLCGSIMSKLTISGGHLISETSEKTPVNNTFTYMTSYTSLNSMKMTGVTEEEIIAQTTGTTQTLDTYPYTKIITRMNPKLLLLNFSLLNYRTFNTTYYADTGYVTPSTEEQIALYNDGYYTSDGVNYKFTVAPVLRYTYNYSPYRNLLTIGQMQTTYNGSYYYYGNYGYKPNYSFLQRTTISLENNNFSTEFPEFFNPIKSGNSVGYVNNFSMMGLGNSTEVVIPFDTGNIDIALSDLEIGKWNFYQHLVLYRQNETSVQVFVYMTVKEILHTIASLGIYFSTVSNPTSFVDNPLVYLGIMDENGETNGEWTNDTTLKTNSIQEKMDDISDTPVTPFVPETPEQPDDATKRTGDSQNLTAPVNLIGCAGFLTNYIMTNVNMQNFGQSLWASFNDSAFWQSLGAVFSDSLSVSPSDVLKYIVSLRCYPINLWELERTAVDRLYIGRGTSGIDIGVGLSYTTEMTMFKSCGSVSVPARYGNYLDYYPYTQVSIYLPFCGEFELSATEVVGSSLTVHYAIDFTTGMCTAWVLSSADGVEYIVLSASGQMGQDIQITAGNLSQVALSIATAGFSAIKSGIDYAKENEASSTYTGAFMAGASGFVNNLKTGLFPSSVLPNPSFTSFYAPMTPYIKIKSSRVSKPANWSSTSGNVAQRSVVLGSMSGFVQCVNPDVSGIPATESELAEIRAMLEHGVYV